MMESQENQFEQNEAKNCGQFQPGDTHQKQQGEPDESGYTEGESEFADGEGTQLAEEFAIPDKEELEAELDESEENFEDFST